VLIRTFVSSEHKSVHVSLWHLITIVSLNNTCSFIHFIISCTSDPKPLPKQVLHRVWSDASSSFHHFHPSFFLSVNNTSLFNTCSFRNIRLAFLRFLSRA